MVTIKEIAAMMGVSPTTVANVIHGRTSKVSKENVERIQKALKEHNYVSKLGLNSLTRGKTRMIGVVAHSSKKYEQTLVADPFYGLLIGTLEQEIRRAGYYMMLYTEEDLDSIFQMALYWNVEALITVTFAWNDHRKLASLVERPVVGIDIREGLTMEDYYVGLDDLGGAYEMTSYLMSCGYERIVIVIEVKKGSDIVRLQGYKKALREAGLPFHERDCIVLDPVNMQRRREQIKGMLSFAGENTALFCVSDQMASEICNYFTEHGCRVPEDIGIAGYDDNIYARLVSPHLTTVRQDVRKKAVLAAQMALELTAGREVEGRHVLLPTEVVARESTKRRGK